jgi:hypothetical protein
MPRRYGIMSHVWPVTILISALHYHKLHNANLYACRIVVPWPLISPTSFPRKLLDLPTSLPPPLPQLYPGSSLHLNHHPRHHHTSLPFFPFFSSFGNLFLSLIPRSIASSFRPLSFAASLFQYTTVSISSFPRLWTPDCAIVLQTACKSIRACERPPRRPIKNLSQHR